MPRTPKDAKGYWLRGDSRNESLGTGREEGPPPADAGRSPSWNNSTMLLQTLRDKLVDHGWGNESVSEIPHARGSQELPARPMDLGEGVWR